MKTLTLLVVAMSAPLMSANASTDFNTPIDKGAGNKNIAMTSAREEATDCSAVNSASNALEPQATLATHDHIVINADGTVACAFSDSGKWEQKFVYQDGRLSKKNVQQLSAEAKKLGVTRAPPIEDMKLTYRATLKIDGLDLQWGHRYSYEFNTQGPDTAELVDVFSYDTNGTLVKFERITSKLDRE